MERMVLAYADGLDSSAIPWLAGHYRSEIIAGTIAFGDGEKVVHDELRGPRALSHRGEVEAGMEFLEIGRLID